VNNLNTKDGYSIQGSFPKSMLWAVILLFVMGFIAGGFILGAVHNAILLIVVVVIFGLVASLLIWNVWWGRRGAIAFVNPYPDADRRSARDGQYVKVTGLCNSDIMFFLSIISIHSLSYMLFYLTLDKLNFP
jgi:TM2 domain-containing membrane protein YozV